MDKKTLVLIDGHALAFRSYFALERTGMKTSDKQPTWAVFGFFKAIFDLLKNKNIKFDSIGVAFDVSHQTFRVEKYKEYKANREAMPDNLQSQMKLIYEGLKAFNIPIYTKEGYEADDVIGTIATKACDLGHNTIILTGDQDAFQLIQKNGCITVLIPSKGELVTYDWQRVHDKLGVYPDQIIDYKALRGDTSDNIPGIRGIGEKTAAKLLTDWGTLKNIYDHIDEISAKAVKTKLIEGEEMANLSQFLATIKLDVDVDFDFEKTNIEMPDVEKVITFLKNMQFYSFLKNLEFILKPFMTNEVDSALEQIKEAERNERANSGSSAPRPSSGPVTQLGLFASSSVSNSLPASDAPSMKDETPNDVVKLQKPSLDYVHTIKTLEELKKLIQDIKEERLISLSAQTAQYEKFDSDLIGICIGYGDLGAFYIPIGHDEGEQLASAMVLEELKPILEDEKIKKTIYDLKHETNTFCRYGINLKGISFDTMLASYINDPSRKHDLKGQAIEHLDYIMKDLTDIIGKGKSQMMFNQINIEKAADFACEETFINLQLTSFWEKKLDEENKKLLFDIEIPTAVVLAAMEFVGVRLDLDYLSQLSQELTLSLEKIEGDIYKLAGEEFNVNSPKQVARILFEKLEIKPGRKKKGAQNFSTDAKVLTDLAQDYEIAKCLLQQRHCYKIKNTYVDALPFMVSPYDEKVHTHYNQTTTVTGRLSSSDPNLQNIPIKTELGNRIRKAFIPEDRENQVLLSADYSQIELRLLAHVSGDEHLIEAFKSGEDIHAQTAAKIFDIPLKDVTKSMRSRAKAVNFGIVYGQTRYGLASALNISAQEAQTFIDKYFETYPKVKEYMEKAVEDAYKYGYAKTMYGRKRYLLDELVSSNHQIKEFAQRAAINSPLQGAAADIIKLAMIDLYKKLQEGGFNSKMIMQVHDELVLQVNKDELEQVKRLVVEAMELGQPFKVPLLVDVEIGSTWMDGEA